MPLKFSQFRARLLTSSARWQRSGWTEAAGDLRTKWLAFDRFGLSRFFVVPSWFSGRPKTLETLSGWSCLVKKSKKLEREGEGWWKHHFQMMIPVWSWMKIQKYNLHIDVIPSGELTWEWNIHILVGIICRNYIFKGSIFHYYVSAISECISWIYDGNLQYTLFLFSPHPFKFKFHLFSCHFWCPQKGAPKSCWTTVRICAFLITLTYQAWEPQTILNTSSLQYTLWT